MEKDKFGKWFIKSYWKAMLYASSVMLLIIGYIIYGLFALNCLTQFSMIYTGHLGYIIGLSIVSLPAILFVIGLCIYWVYSDYKKYKGEKNE